MTRGGGAHRSAPPRGSYSEASSASSSARTSEVGATCSSRSRCRPVSTCCRARPVSPSRAAHQASARSPRKRDSGSPCPSRQRSVAGRSSSGAQRATCSTRWARVTSNTHPVQSRAARRCSSARSWRPSPCSAAASAMSRELKRKGIDSYVIRRGELNKAVSLGVFSDAKRAEKHQQRMQARGYGADIRKISKFAQRLWLVLKAESDSEIYRSGIAYLQALAGEGQTVEKKSCNRIASYKEFD